MRLATNERWTDKENQKQERTEWHRIVAWGKQGENCAKFLDKGRQVYVEGRIQTRSWDDKATGEKRYMTEIVATAVQFLGGNGANRSSDAPPREEPPPQNGNQPRDNFPPPGDDDIPF